jgi:predicted oxidoreductase (fatty acid repression mutant protein)
MVDQRTSSAGKVVFFKDSDLVARLGESRPCCHSANAGAFIGTIIILSSGGMQENSWTKRTYDHGGLLTRLLAHR